eukprot:COSAG05_NODE_13479_length_428_cov_1.127660_2_plen_61_part_01
MNIVLIVGSMDGDERHDLGVTEPLQRLPADAAHHLAREREPQLFPPVGFGASEHGGDQHVR